MIRRLHAMLAARRARIWAEREQHAARTKGPLAADADMADTSRPAPGLAPAPPITLPLGRRICCTLCGDPLEWGIAHHCGHGPDLRPQRRIA